MISRSEAELDSTISRLETSRDLTRDIVHVDMDAFYAAVEMRDDPALKDVHMAVGSTSMLVCAVHSSVCLRYRLLINCLGGFIQMCYKNISW